MIFLEAFARPLLILHALGGAVVVGATTHQLLWCRAYFRGDYRRHRAEKRFVAILALAYLGAFVGGNLIYPTYKVRVRAEYFDDVRTLAEHNKLRLDHRMAPTQPNANSETNQSLPPNLSSVARTFDIKEHCVALGCAAAMALFWLSRRAHPHDVPESASLYLGLSLFACFAAWVGVLVGLYTASFRAIGT